MADKRQYLAWIGAGVTAVLLLYGCTQQGRPAESGEQDVQEQIKNEQLIQ